MHDPLEDHLPSVFRFAMHLCGDRHLAEDLAQEAMLRAVRGISKLKDPRTVKVWLFRIVENLWRDWWRKHGSREEKNKSNSLPHLELQQITQKDLEPSQQMAMAEEVAAAMKALHQLPEQQRNILHLVACEELSTSEVAEVLQISPAAVRSSLSVARSQMRNRLYPTTNSNQSFGPKGCELEK